MATHPIWNIALIKLLAVVIQLWLETIRCVASSSSNRQIRVLTFLGGQRTLKSDNQIYLSEKLRVQPENTSL